MVGAAAIVAAATGGYFYAKRWDTAIIKGAVEQSDIGRKEAVPLPGPIGGGSLSSWKEPEVKKKEEPGDLSSAEKVPSKLKLREPEDNKNKNLSSADDQGN